MLEYFDGCQRSSSDELQQQPLIKENQPRTQLTGVKSDLYNPIQSTLRRYDIENKKGKLSDEHLRHALPPGLDTLPNYNNRQFESPQIIYPGYDLLSLPNHFWDHKDTGAELSFLRDKEKLNSWKKFVDNVPLLKTMMSYTPKNNDFRFHNYAVKNKNAVKLCGEKDDHTQKYSCRLKK